MSRQGVIPQEITQLCRCIDLRLPCILALPNHGCRHDVISVLGGNEVCCLEEDGRAVRKRETLPCCFCCQSFIYGLVDVRRAGVGVLCDNIGMGRGIVLRKDRGIGDLFLVSILSFYFTSLFWHWVTYALPSYGQWYLNRCPLLESSHRILKLLPVDGAFGVMLLRCSSASRASVVSENCIHWVRC